MSLFLYLLTFTIKLFRQYFKSLVGIYILFCEFNYFCYELNPELCILHFNVVLLPFDAFYGKQLCIIIRVVVKMAGITY